VLTCGKPLPDRGNRVIVRGSGMTAPKPGEAPALGGHGEVYIVERRLGNWVIVSQRIRWIS
jgi:hypothetical protein